MTGEARKKTAVVTGAASGIGRSLALALAKEGYNLALCDLDAVGLINTKADLGDPPNVITSMVDVSDSEAVFAFADEVVRHFGFVDQVYNNAGVTVVQPFDEISQKDFEWVMNIDFWGVVHGCRAFIPIMKKQGFGHLINMSSIFGVITIPSQSAYNAAKFAVRGFTECIRQELRPHGIYVSCIHPGGIRTNIAKNARFYQDQLGRKDQDRFAQFFEKMAPTSSEMAARIILDGVRRKKTRILVGKDAKLMALISRVFPASYDRVLEFMYGRKVKK